VDAFDVLGLPYDPDLTDAQVHAAYRLRLRATHPDSGGDVVCAAAVTAAYSALRSGVRRADVLGVVAVGALAGDGAGPAGGAAGLGVTDAGTLARIGELVATARVAGERAVPLRAGTGAMVRGGRAAVCGGRGAGRVAGAGVVAVAVGPSGDAGGAGGGGGAGAGAGGGVGGCARGTRRGRGWRWGRGRGWF
jgi:hypothetical protein